MSTLPCAVVFSKPLPWPTVSPSPPLATCQLSREDEQAATRRSCRALHRQSSAKRRQPGECHDSGRLGAPSQVGAAAGGSPATPLLAPGEPATCSRPGLLRWPLAPGCGEPRFRHSPSVRRRTDVEEGSAGLLRVVTCSSHRGHQAPQSCLLCRSGVGAGVGTDTEPASLGSIAANPILGPLVPQLSTPR